MTLSRCSQCGADTIRSRPPPQELDVASPGTRRHTLLHSNEVPLEAEAAVIEADLAPLNDRLLDLDAEMLRLRGELEQLEKERALVSEYRALNLSVISPLRRVPPEILGYIFSWTLPTAREALQMPVRVKESPWSLSHVSRYWRSVALSEASLWSLVTLYYDAPAPVYPFPMVETQVARAKKLKLHFYGQKTPTPQLLQIETFRLLARFAPQWEELSLGLTPQLVPLLSALRDRLPILRRLFLQWQPDVPEIHRVDCFQNAPSLVGAWVRGFRSIPVLFPGHHLTHYEFHSSSWDTHADILKQTLTLVVARITIEFDDDGDDSWQDPDSREIINLTCLRHLFVSHAEILNFLRLPALEQVAINSSADEGSNILGALRSTVSLSSCVLRRLCLWELPLLTPVTEILTQFPSIVDLAVLLSTPEDSPLAETLMKRLTITADGPVIAPQLRRISFAYEEDMVIDHGIYEEMIKSRWRAGGFAGSELLAAVGSSPTAAVLHGLEKLREEGLNFVFLQGRDAADAIVAWTFEGRWG